jgi:hypothetical protein
MKNYLKFILVILFMVALSDLHGQIKAGRIIGLNLSTMSLKDKDIHYDTKILAGIRFGGLFEIPLTGKLALQPGVLFSSKGTVYKIDTSELFISPVYIEVPVNAAYSFGSEGVKISLLAGLYFAFGIGGNMTDPGGILRSIRFGSEEKDDMKIFDMGLNLGAVINIKGLMISVQYGSGLTNLSPVLSADSEMKNKVIGISFTSLFSGKK